MLLPWSSSCLAGILHNRTHDVFNQYNYEDEKKCDALILADHPCVSKIIRTEPKLALKYPRTSTIIYPVDKYSSYRDIYPNDISYRTAQSSILTKQRVLDKYVVIGPDKQEFVAVDVLEMIERKDRPVKFTFKDHCILVYPENTNVQGLECYPTASWGGKYDLIKKDIEEYGNLEFYDQYSHRNETMRNFFKTILVRHAIYLFAAKLGKSSLGQIVKSYILGPLDLWITNIISTRVLPTEKSACSGFGSITSCQINAATRLRKIDSDVKLKQSLMPKKERVRRKLYLALENEMNRQQGTLSGRNYLAFSNIEIPIRKLLPDNYDRYQRHANYIASEILDHLKNFTSVYSCFETVEDLRKRLPPKQDS